MTAQTISREVARRYLTLHHFLAPPRSLPAGTDGILAVFDRLGSIQFDPIEIAGRNQDLVLLARVADYRRELTDRLLYEERALFETYDKVASSRRSPPPSRLTGHSAASSGHLAANGSPSATRASRPGRRATVTFSERVAV